MMINNEGKKSMWFKMLDKLKLNQYALNTFENYIEQNPYSIISYYKPEKKIALRLEEYRRWFSGNENELELFYKRNGSAIGSGLSFPSNKFWSLVKGNMPKVHYPLPQIITQTMSSLLFNTTPKLSISGNNETNTFEYDEILYDVLNKNDSKALFQKGSQLESFSGGLASSFTTDSNKEVKLQFYSQDEIELKSSFNSIDEIIFKNYFEEGKESYLLFSNYGKGYIKYSLEKITKNGNKEIPLNSTKTTEDLKDIYIIDNKTGKPVNILMAAFKPNRTGSNEFINTLYGRSDYEGLTGTFNAADEAYSTLNDYYRNGRIFTIVSESLLQKDSRGNVTFDTWGINNIMRLTSTPEEAKENADRVAPDISNITYLLDGLKRYTEETCRTVGISPITLGLDNAGANSSSEALDTREGFTEKTRADKLNLWDDFLKKISKLIILYRMMVDIVPTESKLGLVYVYPEELDTLNVNVVFSPFNEETIDEKFNRYYPLVEKGYMTKNELLKRMYMTELTPQDFEKMKIDLLSIKEPEDKIPEKEDENFNKEEDKSEDFDKKEELKE